MYAVVHILLFSFVAARKRAAEAAAHQVTKVSRLAEPPQPPAGFGGAPQNPVSGRFAPQGVQGMHPPPPLSNFFGAPPTMVSQLTAQHTCVQYNTWSSPCKEETRLLFEYIVVLMCTVFDI